MLPQARWARGWGSGSVSEPSTRDLLTRPQAHQFSCQPRSFQLGISPISSGDNKLCGHTDAAESMWNTLSTRQRERAGRLRDLQLLVVVVVVSKGRAVPCVSAAAPLLLGSCGPMGGDWGLFSRDIARACARAHARAPWRATGTCAQPPRGSGLSVTTRRGGGADSLHIKWSPEPGVTLGSYLRPGDTEASGRVLSVCML